MPIYEYRCGKCGQINEFLIMGKQEQLNCKHCGSEDLTKLLLPTIHQAAQGRVSVSPPQGGAVGNPIHAVHRGAVAPGRQRSRRGALMVLSDFFLGHDLTLDNRQ